MKICYLDFWPLFNLVDDCHPYQHENNWFNLLFNNIYTDRIITYNNSPDEADIIIFSCFGEEYKKYKNSSAILISYLGENVKPDFNYCHYSLSFDFDTYNGKNFRLPHWFLYLNWWNEANAYFTKISELEHKYNPVDIYNRDKFCSIVTSNPVQNRIDTYNSLSKYERVDGFGTVFGERCNSNKLDILKDYRFNICFENSISNGYITEKLLQAKIAGCIPIYYGDDSVKFDFNEKCFIDSRKFNDNKELTKYIAELDNNPDKFDEICSEPLFNILPNLDNLTNFLRGIIA